MQPTQAIVDRIKKLQALATNAGTEAEAALAASRVAKLCEAYNLEIGSVMLEKEETEATEARWDRAGAIQAHWSNLAHAVCSLFDVGWYRTSCAVPVILDGKSYGSTPGTRLVFYGLKANVQSAQMSYEYLVSSVEAMLKGWLTENVASPSGCRSFRMGCASRIYQEASKVKADMRKQLDATPDLACESMAIVRVGNELIKKHAEKMRLRKGSAAASAKDTSAWSAGYQSGGRVDIHGARTNRMLA